MNTKKEIFNSFNNQAGVYEKSAKVQQEIGERLLDRLQYLKINPRYILDLGCGPGLCTQKLKKYYPQAQVVAVDLAHAMLLQAKAKHGWRKKSWLVNADMMNLPFATGLFDLVFSNQVFHWSSSLSKLVEEINRVMNIDGCLMFSTLGPDTFTEIKQSWATADKFAHTIQFSDMHDLGDALMAGYFLDPVVDMEMLTVHYSSFLEVIQGLKMQGVRNINSKRNQGLTGKKAWSRFQEGMTKFQTVDGKFPLSYEVVYGHAWKGAQQKSEKGVETFIPISRLRNTLSK